MSDSAKKELPMSDSLTQTAQAKEELIARIERGKSRGSYPEAQAHNMALDGIIGLIEDDGLDGIIAAVLADKKAELIGEGIQQCKDSCFWLPVMQQRDRDLAEETALRLDVEAKLAAVLADHDAQTRQAFEAGWESGRGRFAESLSTADVSKAYAAYLAAPPAQKGTP